LFEQWYAYRRCEQAAWSFQPKNKPSVCQDNTGEIEKSMEKITKKTLQALLNKVKKHISIFLIGIFFPGFLQPISPRYLINN